MPTVTAAQAAEHQRMMRARTRNKAARERALGGSPAAAAAVETAWEPLLTWLGEDFYDGGTEADDESDGQILNVNPGVE